MVDVFHVETGATLRRFPVDARELVASGQYAFTAPPAPVIVPGVAASRAPEMVEPVTPPAPKRRR
jgi:hypothetical protein